MVLLLVEDILDQQDALEARSYDAPVGREAVFAARRAIEALPSCSSSLDCLSAILDALDDVRSRQRANCGEYSSGAATIGSIVAAIRLRFGLDS